MTRQLAQFNYARLRHPLADDRSKGFRDGSAVLTRLAQRSAGFVWALDIGAGGVPEPPVWNDPLISVNMSVWRDFPSLEFFVYNTLHKSWVKRSPQWFEVLDQPYLVMWWVAEGHRPTLEEGLDRLAMLRAQGEGERAFGWAWGREHCA